MTEETAEQTGGAAENGTTIRTDSGIEGGDGVRAGRERFALPTVKLFLVIVSAAVVIGGVAAGFCATLQPAWVSGVLMGAAATAIGCGIGIGSIKPWVAREGRKWGLAMLRANGIGLIGTLVVGGLLYSSTPVNPGAMGLSVPLVFIATWVSIAKVLEGVLREKGLAG